MMKEYYVMESRISEMKAAEKRFFWCSHQQNSVIETFTPVCLMGDSLSHSTMLKAILIED